jgi:hypothetical protein
MQGWGQKLLTLTVAVSLAAGLTSCTTSQIDSIPTVVGGLPENAPRRPEQPPEFPAVHTMPPPRAAALLDEEQQKKLEADLIAARNRHPGQEKNRAKSQKAAAQKSQAPKANPTPAAARAGPGAFPVPFVSPSGDGNPTSGR